MSEDGLDEVADLLLVFGICFVIVLAGVFSAVSALNISNEPSEMPKSQEYDFRALPITNQATINNLIGVEMNLSDSNSRVWKDFSSIFINMDFPSDCVNEYFVVIEDWNAHYFGYLDVNKEYHIGTIARGTAEEMTCIGIYLITEKEVLSNE